MTNEKLPVPEGAVLNDKYQVGRLLGRGGMGVVMAARHLLLDTDVALKFLITSEADVVARFSREARAAAQIQSEHVARVLDVGALADGAPFMVMEYLAGEDLSQVLTRGPLSVSDAVDYILQACEAIAEAHALGIVHRDLKPANLFLARRAHGRSMVKVLDFGISRGGARAGTPTLTGTAVLGSPQYMSPEQWTASRSVDARSDVWSLGVVLYEMLVGARPFDGDSLPVVFTAIAHGTPAPLPASVPPALAAAVLRCLEKDPARRFTDVASFAAAIGGFGTASSRPLLDRIAHVAGVKQAGIAATVQAVAGTASIRPRDVVDFAPAPDAAEVAMRSAVGGTAVLSTALPPRAERAAVASRARPGPEAARPTVRQGRPRGRMAAIAGATIAIGVVAIVLARLAARSGGPDRITPSPPRASEPSASPTAPPPRVAPPPSPPPRVAPPPAAPVAVPAPTPEAAERPSPEAAERPSPEAAERPSPPATVDAPEPKRTPHVARKPAARAPAAVTVVDDAAAAPAAGRGRSKTSRPDATKPGSRWSAACSRLLERQSLGETLSKEDLALYVRECRR